LDFWFENDPSGNPAFVIERKTFFKLSKTFNIVETKVHFSQPTYRTRVGFGSFREILEKVSYLQMSTWKVTLSLVVKIFDCSLRPDFCLLW
jgi:hypothetical protein